MVGDPFDDWYEETRGSRHKDTDPQAEEDEEVSNEEDDDYPYPIVTNI